MPSITDTRRRSSKSSSSKRSSPTSASTSILSGKIRSNSTPNPEPVSRLSARQSKPNRSKEEPIDEQSNDNSALLDSYPRQPKSTNLPDVFTFLEKDEEGDSGAEEEIVGATIRGGPVCTIPHPELPMPNTPHYSDLEVHANEAHEQDIWRHTDQHGASFHSDSGISMGSSSPEIKLHKSKRRQSGICTAAWSDDVDLNSFGEPHAFKDSSELAPLPDFASPSRSWTSMAPNLNDTPEAYYTSAPHTLAEMAQYPRTPISEGFSPAVSQGIGDTLPKTAHPGERINASGYDLLASSIDSSSEEFLRPIYRKFETLNHRMLLYLQDEISEIEESLLALDDTIALENQHYGSRPASRRAEARFPSPLQWQRNDLLARSVIKVEQYSKDGNNCCIKFNV